MVHLIPMEDRVIIKPSTVSEESTTKSGIVIPDTDKEQKPQEGEVIAVGPGRLLDNGEHSEMEVKVGQKVLFNKYVSLEIKIEGEECLVVNESDILAIIEK